MIENVSALHFPKQIKFELRRLRPQGPDGFVGEYAYVCVCMGGGEGGCMVFPFGAEWGRPGCTDKFADGGSLAGRTRPRQAVKATWAVAANCKNDLSAPIETESRKMVSCFPQN